MVGGYEKASFSLFRRGIIHIQRKKSIYFSWGIGYIQNSLLPASSCFLDGASRQRRLTMVEQGNFLQADKGIIIAADVATIEECQRLAELGNQAPEIVAIKVGFSLALRYGLPLVVKSVREVSSLPLIYDHQKAATDIPAMGRSFAQICRYAGVEGVIFFPQAGPKTLEAFVSAAFESQLTPAVGLVMTHPAYLQSEGGFIADKAPEVICQLAIDLGVRAFVLPGTKPEIVKKFADGPLSAIKPVTIMMRLPHP